MLEKIEHVVVLMLENRSFDNVLGWLYAPDNAPPYDRVPDGQRYEGLSGRTLENPIPAEALGDDPTRGSATTVSPRRGCLPTTPCPDPGEAYADVNTQLFGTVLPAKNANPKRVAKPKRPYNAPEPVPAKAPMTGFVASYFYNLRAALGRAPTFDEYSAIMDCFTPDQLPVLSSLAHHYGVFDHWFGSVPSQTLCNRSFNQAGTSHGLVLNSPYYHWLFHEPATIFDRLADARERGLSWRVYFDEADIVSLTKLTTPRLRKYPKSCFQHMDRFHQDATEGTLPSYSVIEPRFTIDHNDGHPPVSLEFMLSSMLGAEKLVHDVYRSLREGKRWEQTLLLINFDEHGGCYEHVSPPAAKPPHPGPQSGQQDFGFDRLGPRVPAILVTPYIEAGTVINDEFEHTSVISTLNERWSLPPLTDRDASSRSLGRALNRSSPRQDRPPIAEPLPYTPCPNHASAPLSVLQRGFLLLAAASEQLAQISNRGSLCGKIRVMVRLLRAEMKILRLRTIGEAVAFIEANLVHQDD